ncbi:hypothetical protein [Streptomyces sp. S.PB5]|uniref:hypothetical protein n=1 Tax=Streptomyces sp. S.PB5 TaxID=3020844 RepID=UPI0025B19225|nr:hypothetical protein [Streptomyces sp. S.PB5]MDN3027585.1 hypothetical protein [Streptomyces sp. S.PB5]
MSRDYAETAGRPLVFTPVRAHTAELMPDILDGVPADCQDMADRKSLEVLITP